MPSTRTHTDKDICHVLNCAFPAAEVQWFPSLQTCIQVCEAHAFDTLPGDAVLDVARAVSDHEHNLILFSEASRQ